MNNNNIYTVGSMFAGIGGICLAFRNAGFKVKWANEMDKNACITYRNNFPDHKLIEKDVRYLKNIGRSLGYVDVITSGFPCQAFSVAGYRKGFKDPRGNLFFETAKFIDILKPKAFLLENVRNLKGHDGGKTFNTIKKTITEELGYSFIYFILNSKDYGNIPQNRERIYMVGFRDEKNAHMLSKDSDLCDMSSTSNFKIPKNIKLTKTINDVLVSEKVPEKYYYKDSHHYFEKLSKAIKSERTLYQWRRVYVRENKNNLCPTLTANMGTGGHNVPILKNGHGIRKLIPRECLRFQGFPDNFRIPNNLANSHMYKQIGNSVVVPVVERIAHNIKEALDISV